MHALGARTRVRPPVVAAGLAVLLACPIVASAPQEPTFRSAVNLVAVDVHVVDSQGQPVGGLGPDSFEVSINGRRRRVVSADFVDYASDGGPHLPDEEMRVGASRLRPSAGAPGRTFVVAIDAMSFTPGESVAVIEAAQGFVSRLAETDLVGVFMLPRGNVLSPTSNRAAVRQALGGIVGLQTMRPSRFNLTPAEIVDIDTAAGLMDIEVLAPPSGRGGGATAQMDERHDLLREVQLRECRGAEDRTCLQGILLEAEQLAQQMDQDVAESLAGMNHLLRQLQEYPGRKTVVLISGGIPMNDGPGSWYRDGGQARAIGRDAARANAMIYSLHIDRGYRSLFSAESRTPRRSVPRGRERQIEELLLTEYAIASGGAMFSVATGIGERALDRVLRETSSFYLLGVAPDALDFDGETHELRVKVGQRGTTIRSRQYVVLRPGS